MATTTTPPTESWNRDDTQRRVEHPLQRLRGYIRTYVGAEGVLLLILYLALWFWISLALDFGFFKVFGVDFVQVLPLEFRGTVLALLVAGLLALVASKMLLRLFREFRTGALALVLERRFPAELGDRLITAVELADTGIAKQYGYSQLMIDQTIRDAAERVDKLPVAQVFDWRRLRRYTVRALLITLGIYVAVGAVYLALARSSVEDFAIRFNNVAGIWFERNVLLSNTIWPRRAYLELIGFPPSGELRVGRDAPPPTLRVRALKWVVADPSAPEGWRAMHFSDVTRSILGEEVPNIVLPERWQVGTLDDIEQQLDKPESHLNLDTHQALRSLFAQMHARAESPRMARKFRELMIPREVTVYYRGATVRSEQSLKKQAESEYAGILSDLKESVRFTANGEDYYTPYQQITLVPPPSLVALLADEEQPAYLYQRAPAGMETSYLKGKKQLFLDRPLSLSGNASRIEVPAGTNVTLKGTADKPLGGEGGIHLLPREASAPLHADIQRAGPESFAIRFNNVTATLDFLIEMIDPDNVKGLRHVVIKPTEDAAPEVDVQVEVVRKTAQGYMVTASAKIPFSGRVRDDYGLSQVDFLYTKTSLDDQTALAAAGVGSTLLFTPRVPAASLLAPGCLAWLGQVIRSAADDIKEIPQRIEVGAFATRRREFEAASVPVEEFEQRLRQPPQTTLLRDLNLDPREFRPEDLKEVAFDVERLGLKVGEDRKYQPRYRMRLWIEATDNNEETGPGKSDVKEKFLFLIVPENDLIVEIGKEEEGLHVKLEDTINKLKDARAKLDQVKQELPLLKANEFSPMARRVEELLETLARGLDASREVYGDYSKILRELRVNMVRQQFIDRVDGQICTPLNDAINQEFDHSDKSLKDLLKMLEEKKKDLPTAETAVKNMDDLIERLTRVLDAMGEMMTINKLIEQLIELEKEERAVSDRFKVAFEKAKEDILNKVFEKPETKKP